MDKWINKAAASVFFVCLAFVLGGCSSKFSEDGIAIKCDERPRPGR